MGKEMIKQHDVCKKMSNSNPKTELETELKTILETTPLIEEEEAQSGRHHVISFKVSTAEKERLNQRCSGVVVSDYIRARLFEYSLPRPKTIMPEVNRETLYHLKRIGANINQQTKAIHSAIKVGQQPLTNEIYKYLLELKELQDLINLLRTELIAEKGDPTTDD
jgi:hypothetical protein